MKENEIIFFIGIVRIIWKRSILIKKNRKKKKKIVSIFNLNI
jgi:hypothetical protein